MNHNMHGTPISLPSFKGRLNLIFHGLMAFREAGDQYEVLLPKPCGTGHVLRYGNPYDEIRPLQEDCYTIEGVSACESSSPQHTGKDCLLFDNSLLEVQRGHVAASIFVPKPDIIRGYRGVETRGLDMARGDCTHRSLHCPPDVLHEVTVLSYFNVHSPVLKSSCDSFAVPHYDIFWNLCVYSQSPTFTPGEDHSSLFNNMFRVKRADGGTDPLNMRISLEGGILLADDPPVRTASRVGIRYFEFFSLSELCHKDNAKLIELAKGAPGSGGKQEIENLMFTADPSSCSSGFGRDHGGS